MAQIDFPSNPQVNDTFIANGITYTWDGVKWDGTVVISGGSSGSSNFSTEVTAPSYEADNTGTDTVLFDFQRSNTSQFQITTEPAINVLQPLDLKLPDNSALPFRIMEGTTEYLRVSTTDDAELFDFKKPVTTSQVLTLGNSVDTNTGANSGIINVQGSEGQALRVNDGSKTGNAAELFRFNTNVTPALADFSCAVKFDNDVETAFGTLTVSDALNVVIPSGNSNGLDIVADGDLTTFGLRFNTNLQQLITDYDFVNENNDGVIQLGGTVAAPLLKIYPGNIQASGMLNINTTSSTMPLVFGSNTSYTFLAPNSTTAMTRFVVEATDDHTINIPDVAGDMAVNQTDGIDFNLLQQTGSSGHPTNSGTSHFYSDISLGFTGSMSQLDDNKHVSKFIIQRNFAGNTGGLVIKGGRPHEAGNGTQNILDIHYQDVSTGDDIRYYGSTANNNSLQNKTSTNALIDNKIAAINTALAAIKAASEDASTDLAGFKAAIATALSSF